MLANVVAKDVVLLDVVVVVVIVGDGSCDGSGDDTGGE